MEQIISLIEKHSHVYEFLQECPYRILKNMSVCHYQKGDMVYHQGDSISHFFIIVEGTANIFVMSENGRKYSQAINQSGDFIGEIEIFDRLPSVSNVKALSDLTLIGISAEHFHDWLKIDDHMSNIFNRSLSKYLYNLATKSGVDSLYPLKFRLCGYLLEMMTAYQNGTNIVKIDKKELSEQLAVTLRSVNRILRDLTEKNVIAFKKEAIIILDSKKLVYEKEKSLHE